jgi:mitogen-activated protein kinase-activated protein kinase 3
MGVIMYILLCGYPPFFSLNGGAISAGITTKIKAGEYQFPNPEWQNISQDAKSIIQKMLTVDPAARVTIDWILQCSWLTGTVPETQIDIRPMLDLDNYEQVRVRKAMKIVLNILLLCCFRLNVSLIKCYFDVL